VLKNWDKQRDATAFAEFSSMLLGASLFNGLQGVHGTTRSNGAELQR
jgi:hypothetical protein